MNLLSVNEAARKLGLSPEALRRVMCNRGQIPGLCCNIHTGQMMVSIDGLAVLRDMILDARFRIAVAEAAAQ
jgi:hypothetical protein